MGRRRCQISAAHELSGVCGNSRHACTAEVPLISAYCTGQCSCEVLAVTAKNSIHQLQKGLELDPHRFIPVVVVVIFKTYARILPMVLLGKVFCPRENHHS